MVSSRPFPRAVVAEKWERETRLSITFKIGTKENVDRAGC
jgi:hypothetical protein